MNKIKELRAASYNPRKITDGQLASLKKAMREFGDLSGIVVNCRTGNMVGGHQRVKCFDPAWEIVSAPHTDAVGTVALGHVETPHGRWTYREVDWPEKKEQAANVAANKHGGEWDIPALKDILVGLDDGEFDLGLTGFTDRELKELIDWEGKAGLTDPDHAPDVPAESITRPGDIWTLGAHRLLCGDSTAPESLARLLGDGKADMVFTDPPYGIDYVPEELKRCSRRRTGHVLGGIEGDQVTWKQSPWLNNVSTYYSGAIYICGGLTSHIEVWTWLLEHTKREPTVIVWVKNNFSIGRRDYHRKHEFIFNDEGWRDSR